MSAAHDHEQDHVVQQRTSPVDDAPAAGGISVSNPSDQFEREAATTAERAMSAPPSAAPSTASTQVQRQAADEEPEEEPVQGSFVQHEGEELQEEPADQP
jgi:hypothetical protein